MVETRGCDWHVEGFVAGSAGAFPAAVSQAHNYIGQQDLPQPTPGRSSYTYLRLLFAPSTRPTGAIYLSIHARGLWRAVMASTVASLTALIREFLNCLMTFGNAYHNNPTLPTVGYMVRV